MQEREASGTARASEGREPAAEAGEAERIRVTDRRRINVEDGDARARGDEGEAADEGEAPRLKPSYVEELEARARAAEQKTLDVQTRFDQVKSELKRETDELRARLQRTADERVRREGASFVASLLPVVDNLRLALEAAEKGGTLETLMDGLRGTLNGFENALAASGVEAVEAVGAEFDPELHEAVDTTEVEPERDNTVTAEYARGYRMGGQLIRPARVQVGRNKNNDE